MKRKKIMKIALFVILAIVVIGGLFFAYKMNQLKKLSQMSVDEMMTAVTQKDGTYVSVAIIENGVTAYHTYGQNGEEIERTDLQYEIGSISKTLAALLVAKAVDEGKLNLSASIDEYLDLPEGKYYPTLERLLTHTSGYKNYYWENAMFSNHLHNRNDFYTITREQLLAKAGEISVEDKDYPFCYSNFGLSIIGLVLERVYQKDYTDLLTDYLKNDLHMNNTQVATCCGNLSGYWDWAENDGYIPAGAVISTIEDMSIYASYYMSNASTYARMPFQSLQTVNVNNAMYLSLGIRMDEMCMAWSYDSEHHIYWHNGGTSNYNSYMAFNEDFTKCVILLSNYGPDKNFPVTVIGVRMMEELD